MALVIIIVLLGFGVGVVWSLFASLTPFTERLGWSVNYNIAYYWAMMSAERWLLALRYHEAGFEWSSWILSWQASDVLPSTIAFGKMTPTMVWSDAYWKITSRTTSWIPGTGQGNVEILYASPDSNNYNTLWYNETIYIPLFMDNDLATGNYYKTPTSYTTLFTDNSSAIRGVFRVPTKAVEQFDNYIDSSNSYLNAGTERDDDLNFADVDDDGVYDDIIVQWGLHWYRNWSPFSIQPTILNDFTSGAPLYYYDNSIRESRINLANSAQVGNLPDTNIDIGSYGFAFVVPEEWAVISSSLITGHNIIPLSSDLKTVPFSTIIWWDGWLTTGLMLSFSITNLMETNPLIAWTDIKWVFPFLEWKLQATRQLWQPITMGDRFFTVDAVWKTTQYQVHFIIKKPVNKSSNISNFTIIF